MPDLDTQVRERISNLSDKDLIKMLTAHPDDYLPEALAFARSEAERRGVTGISADAVRHLEEEEMRQAETNEIPRPKPHGIGGWLVIPAIGIVFAPIKSVVMLFLGISMIQTFAPELTSDARLWASGIIDVAMIIATIVVAVLFFRKRRIAIPAIISLMSAAIVANLVQAFLNAAMFEEVDADTVMPIVHSCVFGAVWIPYFLKSKRVKNTFTE